MNTTALGLVTSNRLRALMGLGSLVALTACGRAEAEPNGGRPPSAIDLRSDTASAPDAGSEGRDGQVGADAPDGTADGHAVAQGGVARPGQGGAPGADGWSSFGSTPAAGLRPEAADTMTPPLRMGSDAVDVDESGPMIHTPPDEEPSDFPDARFPRPEHVRGLYVNAWAAGSAKRMGALLDLARRTEINTFVIDIKDATGYISHRTNVPLAHEIGATEERRIGDLPGLLERLEDEGIYPIARIVVVKDPILSTFRPEVAVQDTAGGVWVDSKEIVWLNPYNRKVWDYHVEIAREVAEMGFPEIQWDYIRFPDAPESDMARAVFPGSEGRSRVDAIRGFLSHAGASLSDLPVRSTADVFGVTTSFNRDIGLGQLWEGFIDVVDVALPMVYPSHYWEGSFGYADPNAYPYEVVRAALRDAQRRSAQVPGAGLTRPWLQDFTLGRPVYGVAEVRAQIQAVYDAGIREWILWNPSTRYTEEALEPVDGFEREPLVRVAGLLTEVSRRQTVMDSVAALPPEPDSMEAVVDPVSGPTVPRDTILPVDTVIRVDTVPPTDSMRGAGDAGRYGSAAPMRRPPATDTVPAADTLRPRR